MGSDGYADDIEHEFQLGDEFEECPAWTWKVTNRMVDVDTEELLYRLRGTNSGLNSGTTRVVTESQLNEGFDRYLHTGSEHIDNGEGSDGA